MDGDVYAGAPRVPCAFSSVLADVPPERVPRYVSSSEAPGSHLRGNTHDNRWAVDALGRPTHHQDAREIGPNRACGGMEWLILDGESRVTQVAKLASVHEVWVATSRTCEPDRY